MIVCAFLAIGGSPYKAGCNHVHVSKSRTSNSLKHWVPSYPPNINNFLSTLLRVWQARAAGSQPESSGVDQLQSFVSKIWRSANHLAPSWPPWMKSLFPTTAVVWLFLT